MQYINTVAKLDLTIFLLLIKINRQQAEELRGAAREKNAQST